MESHTRLIATGSFSYVCSLQRQHMSRPHEVIN